MAVHHKDSNKRSYETSIQVHSCERMLDGVGESRILWRVVVLVIIFGARLTPLKRAEDTDSAVKDGEFKFQMILFVRVSSISCVSVKLKKGMSAS